MEDLKYCENIIKENSKSFYKAFSTLPKKKAYSVYAVYAFCRKIDDVVDIEKNRVSLEAFEEEFKAFKEGKTADDPVWRALRWVFDNFEMSFKPFEDMIKGQYMDIEFKQPENQLQLEDYCYYVAGTVGLMILPILSKHHKELEQVAVELGKAMQITNILRDIGEDYENNRIYLPVDIMDKFHVTKEQLDEKKVDNNFIALWEYEANGSELLYQSVFEKIALFDEDSVLSVLLALHFYKEILFEVRKNNYNCLLQRNHISNIKKIRLYIKCLRLKSSLLF